MCIENQGLRQGRGPHKARGLSSSFLAEVHTCPVIHQTSCRGQEPMQERPIPLWAHRSVLDGASQMNKEATP